MKYHDIQHDDMLNGDGIRVTIFLSGCEHHCKGCQNPITWNPDDGKEVTTDEMCEIFTELSKDYISGITFSGGDPLYPANRSVLKMLCQWIKNEFPDKTIWIYTGYLYEEVSDLELMQYVDVLVDGKFDESLASVTYHWAGSTNQRVIDVQATRRAGEIVLHDNKPEENYNHGTRVCCGE